MIIDGNTAIIDNNRILCIDEYFKIKYIHTTPQTINITAYLSLGEVIGKGMAEDLGGDDIKKLMAGGTEIGDLRDELGA